MLAHRIIVQAPVCSYVTDNLMQPTLQVGFGCLSLSLAELAASVVAVAVLVILPSKNLGANLKLVKQLLHEIAPPTQAYNGKSKTMAEPKAAAPKHLPNNMFWNRLEPYIYDCYKAVVQEQ